MDWLMQDRCSALSVYRARQNAVRAIVSRRVVSQGWKQRRVVCFKRYGSLWWNICRIF